MRLIAATTAMIAAELEDQGRLATLLEAVVPPDWPPEHHDQETLRFWLEQLAWRGAAGWWLYYAVVNDSARPTLIGSVGYKGPPLEGVAEIGYSVVPSWQRRGLATEASQALIEEAWARGAQVVVARTFAHLEPSIGVLRKLGFEPRGPNAAGELEFTLRRFGSEARAGSGDSPGPGGVGMNPGITPR
jgi:ribosomal-protein-alanine N-acetyltransferase